MTATIVCHRTVPCESTPAAAGAAGTSALLTHCLGRNALNRPHAKLGGGTLASAGIGFFAGVTVMLMRHQPRMGWERYAGSASRRASSSGAQVERDEVATLRSEV